MDEANPQASLGAAANDPAVVVLSHCFTCNKDLKAIVRISRRLATLGLTVLRFDMTGLGSSGGDFFNSNFSTNCDDLHDAIEFATTEIGPVRSLMGHSFGGAATLAVAADHTEPQDSTQSLILIAAPSDTTHLAKLLRNMNPKIQSEGIGEVSIGGRQWMIRREMLADFDQHDLTALIPKIKQPTLIFHSPTDETVGFDHAIRIMGLMNGQASLISMNDSDHLLTRHTADWDWVAQTSAAFIRRQAAID